MAHDPALLTVSFKESDAMSVPKAAHNVAHKTALWGGTQ